MRNNSLKGHDMAPSYCHGILYLICLPPPLDFTMTCPCRTHPQPLMTDQCSLCPDQMIVMNVHWHKNPSLLSLSWLQTSLWLHRVLYLAVLKGKNQKSRRDFSSLTYSLSVEQPIKDKLHFSALSSLCPVLKCLCYPGQTHWKPLCQLFNLKDGFGCQETVTND